ncbi:MAG: polysaccharide biosynthesis C-terminal domain-containing protein, partial [Alphaproteobacteria bacterium]|nr:polysaccharide biosynthesis C-terminal domain-containing protein [Alphaproteobacteria bacterium]
LNQLPMAIIATAMGTALLPMMSRQLAKGENDAALETQNRALEMTLALTLPAMVGLIVLAHPIIQVLFERGAFTATATLATSQVLIGFVVGLPAYCLIKLFTPAFFARNDTKTPVRVGAMTVAINIALNLGFIGLGMGVIGIALGTALASWMNLAILILILRRRGFYHMDSQAKRCVPLLILAGLVQMGLLAVTADLCQMWRDAFPILTRFGAIKIVELGGLMLWGGVLYFGTAILLGAIRPEQVKNALSMIRRKFSRKRQNDPAIR